MLYVFSMDTGTMLTFDINLAMKSVLELQSVLAKQFKVPADKQVLLISGGEHLDPEQRVCSYSAGTDTNPIFLFSKMTIESSCLPNVAEMYAAEAEMRDQVEGALNMPPSYETVVTRAQLALQFHDVGREELRRCEQLVHDQHLQHQGWAAAVANLEDITSSFKNRTEIFRTNFEEYLEQRDTHVDTLKGFPVVVELLSRLPLLSSLLPALVASPMVEEPETGDRNAQMSVLDWIAAQDSKNSLDQMADMCHKGIQQLDHEVMSALLEDVSSVLENVNNPNMKEVKGLEDRLYKLEQLMFSARKLVQEQAEMSQGFVQNQNRASNVRDSSIFPDLCASHQQQLLVMLKNHQRLREAREKCAKAKDELCNNLHQRLRWIMYVEKSIYDCDGKLVIHHENLKRLKRRLDIIRHVHSAPQVYAAIVIEIYRRRDFKHQFMNWATRLSGESERLYKDEVTRRNTVNDFVGQHFFRILFPSLAEYPAEFATECPDPFDLDLPLITLDDISDLMKKAPELTPHLCIPDDFDIMHHITSLTSSKDEPTSLGIINALDQSTSDIEVINHPDENSPQMPRPQIKQNDVTSLRPSDVITIPDTKSRHLVQTAISPKESPIEVLTMAEATEMDNTIDTVTDSSDVYHDVTDGSDDVTVNNNKSVTVPAGCVQSLIHHETVVHQSSISTGSSGSKREVSLGSDSQAENSGDFHTGVFFIDESLPSSVNESSPFKKLEELQQSLESKEAKIDLMESEIDSSRNKLKLVEDKLKALCEICEKDTLKLKPDLLSTEKQVGKDDFSAYLDRVCNDIISVIGRYQDEQLEQRRLKDNVHQEYETKLEESCSELRIQQNTAEELQLEIEKMNFTVEDLTMKHCNIRKDSELKLENCKNKCESEIAQVNRRLLLEHEVELERARSVFNAEMQQMDREMTEIKDNLNDKQALVQKLRQQIENVSETLSEQFQGEKAEIVKILEEQFKAKQAIVLNEVHDESAHKMKAALEKLRLEHERQKAREFETFKEKFLQEREQELVLCKTDMEIKHSQSVGHLQSKFKAEKLQALDELRASVSSEKELQVLKLRSEVDTLKCDRLRLVQSASELEEQRISLVEHKRIVEMMEGRMGEQQDLAVNQALSELRREHESTLIRVTETLQQERKDSLNSMRSDMAGEKQVAFNEALNKVVSEKDRIIDDLKKREQLLIQQIHEMQKDVRGFDGMTLSQNVMAQSVVPIRELVSDTDNADVPAKITELESRLRNKEEETTRLQGKLMELSMTHSTRSLMQHDKVSITTCNIGDLVLLCLDERHDHYVVFTVGATLHFLHSDCLETLNLKTAAGESRKSWVLAEVTDKEYCQARKPTNRFKVPVGTKFYRVKARPWSRDGPTREVGKVQS